MATTIKLKNGSGAPSASDLVQGEPAIDLTNKRLYTENGSGAVIEVGSNPSSLSIAGTAITATAAELNILDGVTSTAAELNILDGVTSTAAELNILDGVTSTAAELNILDGVTSTTAELNILDGVTSTTAELNILDGVTSTAAELNILDGVTSTAAELNILDGVTSTATELNILDGVTSTTAELNLLDISALIGTVEASKAVVVDSNKDITGFRNITLSGELDAGSLDISGNADIDGTLETDALSINGTAVTSTAAELNILDGVTSTAAELNILDGVTSTTAELNILDGVTSTAVELNILDGVTSTTAELNILDGVTSTAAELNILDGVTSTAAELNILDGVTSTASELNVLDGVTAFVDEDDMSSNSATSIPSQQSVKAYVDSTSGASSTLAGLSDTNVTSPADAALLFYDTGTSKWIDNVVSGDITIADTGVAAIGSGVIINADIKSDAAIAISKTALVAGTGITLSTNTLNVDASQTQITAVGTIATGVWQGTAIADAYVANDLTISGGTVNNTVIGGSTAAAGTFTTFTSNGIDDNADALAMTISSSEDISIGSASNHSGARIVINDIRDNGSGSPGPPTGFGAPILQIGQEAFTGSGMYSIGFGYTASGSDNPPVEIAALTTADGGSTKADIVFGTRSSTSNTAVTERMRIAASGAVSVTGALSKGSGSFKIDHPLEAKKDTHHLVHSFVEGPQADLIYRGKLALVDGSATVNLDDAARMSAGTFVLLNTNVQCFTSNESGWVAVKGSVSGNVLTITSQESCTDTVSWMVVGERCDQHMLDTEWTDDNGRVIVEPLKL